jgi:UDP-sugar transporter A1/2/3
LIKDYDGIFPKEGGFDFFHGYNSIVWGVILFQAAGGLIVAMVVKYADNIIKNFATSFSILLSALTSAILFRDVQINFFFVLGASTVMGATYAFGYKPPVRVVSRQDLELSMEGQEKDKENQELARLLKQDEDDAKSP